VRDIVDAANGSYMDVGQSIRTARNGLDSRPCVFHETIGEEFALEVPPFLNFLWKSLVRSFESRSIVTLEARDLRAARWTIIFHSPVREAVSPTS